MRGLESSERSQASTISRRKFLKKTTLTLTGLLLGGLGGYGIGKIKQHNKLEEQIHEGRIRPISKETLQKWFGEDILEDNRFQFHDDQLWIDTNHLGWTDQAHDKWKEFLSLLEGDLDHVDIDIYDGWKWAGPRPLNQREGPRPLKKTYRYAVHGKVSIHSEKGTTKEALRKAFEDIILHLRNQTEEGQYKNPGTRFFGATAGVTTDTNANLLSLYIARHFELMEELYEKFGSYDEEQEKIVLNCKSLEVTKYLFGEIPTVSDEKRDALFTYLLATHDITPPKITNKHLGLDVQID